MWQSDYFWKKSAWYKNCDKNFDFLCQSVTWRHWKWQTWRWTTGGCQTLTEPGSWPGHPRVTLHARCTSRVKKRSGSEFRSGEDDTHADAKIPKCIKHVKHLEREERLVFALQPLSIYLQAYPYLLEEHMDKTYIIKTCKICSYQIQPSSQTC